jgi:hypothetical protein
VADIYDTSVWLLKSIDKALIAISGDPEVDAFRTRDGQTRIGGGPCGVPFEDGLLASSPRELNDSRHGHGV